VSKHDTLPRVKHRCAGTAHARRVSISTSIILSYPILYTLVHGGSADRGHEHDAGGLPTSPLVPARPPGRSGEQRGGGPANRAAGGPLQAGVRLSYTATATANGRRPATAHRPAQPMMSYDDYDPVRNHMQSFNCPRRTINWEKGSPLPWMSQPACISHSPTPLRKAINTYQKNGSLIFLE